MENQLIEMRTGEHYTPSGSWFKTVWIYDGLGRARVQTDCAWSGSARAVFLNAFELRPSLGLRPVVDSVVWPAFSGVETVIAFGKGNGLKHPRLDGTGAATTTSKLNPVFRGMARPDGVASQP